MGLGNKSGDFGLFFTNDTNDLVDCFSAKANNSCFCGMI